jgi:Sec-independent protein secretion pathway component TatC
MTAGIRGCLTMAISVRPIGHHDEVSVFAHLGELRGRLIVSVAVLAIAFAFAFWQNHALLQVLNRPLANVGSSSLADSSAPLSASSGTQQKLAAALASQRVAFGLLAASGAPLTAT